MCALDLNAPEGKKAQEYLWYFGLSQHDARLKMIHQFDARIGSYFGRDPND